jgi:hypothetical protein
MKSCTLLSFPAFVLLASLAGCDGPFRTPSHVETLASGGSIEVTSFNLAWGGEHDEHTLGQDCFALEYVTAIPGAEAARRDAEAAEAFELVRVVSEQWGFREATVAAIPTLEHKGPYDLYWYRRAPDGHWWATVVFRDGKWIANALSASPQ